MIQIGTLVLEWYANLSRFCQNALLDEFITVGAVAGSGCGGSGACAATHPTRRPVRLIPPQHVLTLKAEKQKKIFATHFSYPRRRRSSCSKLVLQSCPLSRPTKLIRLFLQLHSTHLIQTLFY